MGIRPKCCSWAGLSNRWPSFGSANSCHRCPFCIREQCANIPLCHNLCIRRPFRGRKSIHSRQCRRIPRNSVLWWRNSKKKSGEKKENKNFGMSSRFWLYVIYISICARFVCECVCFSAVCVGFDVGGWLCMFQTACERRFNIVVRPTYICSPLSPLCSPTPSHPHYNAVAFASK